MEFLPAGYAGRNRGHRTHLCNVSENDSSSGMLTTLGTKTRVSKERPCQIPP